MTPNIVTIDVILICAHNQYKLEKKCLNSMQSFDYFSMTISVKTKLPPTAVSKMENIESYEAASPLKQFTFWDYILLIGSVCFDGVCVLILSIPNTILSIWHCFVYKARKSVAGQTALVRVKIFN